ncbi:MAG: hypothetical protein IKI64_05150 [Clostridia bacterium]|nr:hypothetical protein [Clostridia bacterium]
MKRFICTAMAALIVLSAASACKPQNQSAAKITPKPEATAVSEVTKAPEPTDELAAVPTDEPTEVPTEAPTNTPEPKMEKLDIPVYPDDKLLLNNFIVQIGEDACQFSLFAEFPNKLDYVYELYPTKALRKASTGEEYIIYESQSGYREYVFLKHWEESGLTVTNGFPIVVGELLPYKAFEQLKVGDTIDSVEEIDPIAVFTKRRFEYCAPNVAASNAKRGYPITSIHYLSDGLLKIEYEMLEDGSLVISNMVYSPDYTLKHTVGEVINYRIEPIDLPEK